MIADKENILTENKQQQPAGAFRYTPEVMVLLCMTVLVFAIYSNTLKGPFLFDSESILNNQSIRLNEFTWQGIKEVVQKSFSKNRPVAILSFALNYYLHQYNVMGYHLANMLIHIFTGFFLYLFIKTTLSLSKEFNPRNSALIPFFSALIWLLHPVQTQSVSYIIQRMNSMAAMFYVLSILLYAKARSAEGKRKKQALSAGCIISGALALGSKEIAATLPFFILFYEWYFFQGLSRDWLKRHAFHFAGLLTLLGLVISFFLLTEDTQNTMSLYARQDFTLPQRVLTEFRVVIYYISLLILPHPSRLNLDYDFSLSYSLVNPVTTLFAIAALAGLIGLTVYLAKKERILSFCILWFLGNLVIESSVIGLAIIFEHRLYLPSMFFCLMAVLLIYRYIKPKWMSVLLFCMITFFCSVWTYERNIVWSSSYKLWADCVEKSPEKARPHNNLGLALIERGEVVDAIRHYTEALQIAPDFLEAYNNLGLALVETGRINEAIAHYSKVLQLKPDHAIVRYNLGIALAKLGRVAEAVAQFQKIFQIRPDFEDPYANFGVTLVKKGKIDEAAGFFRNVLRTKPDFAFARGNIDATLDASIKRYAEMLRKNPDDTRAHVHLGVVLTKQNRTAEAVAHYNKALQIKPGYVEAHNNMGIALVKQGRTTEAVKHYNEVLRINPNYVKTLNNLGLALMVQGRTVEAVEHLQEALRIKPDYAKAQYNLGVVLQRPDIQVGSS